ncbi:MAG: hypothetical protein WHS87_08225 [Anaerolineales bacterium]
MKKKHRPSTEEIIEFAERVLDSPFEEDLSALSVDNDEKRIILQLRRLFSVGAEDEREIQERARKIFQKLLPLLPDRRRHHGIFSRSALLAYASVAFVLLVILLLLPPGIFPVATALADLSSITKLAFVVGVLIVVFAWWHHTRSRR